jgi:hypothetical protein
MGVIVKKCLACGTINQYIARSCKQCNSPLLAEVDQDDEIMAIDPMEAAVNDAVSKVEIGDDLVVKILREQAEAAKQIVAKENEKEERKKKRQSSSKKNVEFGGGPGAVSGGGSFGFSIGDSSESKTERRKPAGAAHGTTYGGLDGTEAKSSSVYGFKISSGDGSSEKKVWEAADESSATWSRESNSPRGRKSEDTGTNSKWKIKNKE